MAESDVLTVTVAHRDLLTHILGATVEEREQDLNDYLETLGLRPRDARYKLEQFSDLARDCVIYRQVLRAEGATPEEEHP